MCRRILITPYRCDKMNAYQFMGLTINHAASKWPAEEVGRLTHKLLMGDFACFGPLTTNWTNFTSLPNHQQYRREVGFCVTPTSEVQNGSFGINRFPKKEIVNAKIPPSKFLPAGKEGSLG